MKRTPFPLFKLTPSEKGISDYWGCKREQKIIARGRGYKKGGKMSSYSQIWQFLMDKGSATNAEIAAYMRGKPGQLSFGQRLREIRQALRLRGGDLECHEEKTGVYRYTVITQK